MPLLSLLAVAVAAAAAPSPAVAQSAVSPLSPAQGDRYCRRYEGSCTGASEVVFAGGLFAWPYSAHHNEEAIVARPWRDGRAGPARVIATERGVKRASVAFVAATDARAGEVLVAWSKEEMEGVEAPIVFRARRVSAAGRPLGAVFELGRTGAFGDDRDARGDSVFVNTSLARSASGRLLAGWLTPGARRRYGDSVAVVRPLSSRGRPAGPARPVSDRGADEFGLRTFGPGFLASWTRYRQGRYEVRARTLDRHGRPSAPARTLVAVPAPEEDWWTTPVLGAGDSEVLMVSARRAPGGVELAAQRLDAALSPIGAAAVIGTVQDANSSGATLEAVAAPGGGWLVGAATHDYGYDYDDDDVERGDVAAVRLGPDGRAAGAMRLLARDGHEFGTSMAWDPSLPALAWTAAGPRDANFARIHVAALP